MSDLSKHAVIYVDVDDTLVRHARAAPEPITHVIDPAPLT